MLGSLGLGLATSLGCTPEIDPVWLISEPRELAVTTRLVEPGPLSDPPPDDRTVAEGLPGDLLEFEPLVVGLDGPVPTDALQTAWFACSPSRSCLTEAAEDAPPCDFRPPELPERACSLGRDAVLRVRLPDIDFQVDVDNPFAYFLAPRLLLIASAPGGPGVEQCLARVREERVLDGCLAYARTMPLGPLGPLVELAREAGVEFEDSETLDAAAARPRNLNPGVETFIVSIDGREREVASGGRVQLTAGQTVEVAWKLDQDRDVTTWDVEIDGQTITNTETLVQQWYIDVDVPDFEPLASTVQWTATPTSGPVHLYLVVADSIGGIGWGWIELESTAGVSP